MDRAASGLTGVWSNTADFPPTWFLLGAGARQIEFFKAWTRAHQIPAQVWYSAYPDSTVGNIRDALQTLENLGQTPDAEHGGGLAAKAVGKAPTPAPPFTPAAEAL